ncbi:MAG: acyl-CoA dehydrogenase C-terminal domain-containing protein [Alphaproteobacteria bacterium]
MTTVYRAPVEDFAFVLKDYLGLAHYGNLPGFADAPADVMDAILSEAARFAEKELVPINESGDREGCTYDAATKSVKTPKGFKAAYKSFVEGGWTAMTGDPAYGGQGLPSLLGSCISEMFCSANWSFAMYPGLSHGAYSALHTHGSPEQKRTYLPKLVSGEWSGTMNLTEPQCGTDLGLMRTKAEPQKDGSYAITGTKIWISGGEQDLTTNTVHLVLAKIPGGPDGIKGVSLFVVPKFLVNTDGSLGPRNKAFCGGLEHKMGINANATCVMNYDGATGWLIGEAHKGMRAMFTMMNEARLGVALQGLAISEIAYQNARDFALNRLQGRALTGPKNASGPADPIIVHPDVRRMLMDVKCFNEGARALLLWTALRGDLETKSPDGHVRENAGDMMALLTPVLKAYFTDQGFANAVKCQQVLGGSGFTKEYPLEQFVRDARIGMIYEGANGIQALDLVGRKLAANGGRAIGAFFAEIDKFLADTKNDKFLGPWTDGLAKARKELGEATDWLMTNALTDFDNAGAASYDYLYLMALTALSATWAGIVATAKAKLDKGGLGAGEKAFLETKIATARYFLARVLPESSAHLAKLKSGAAPVMALTAERF